MISPRSPGAYLSSKPRESYVSLRDQKNLSIRGFIFLIEGFYAAMIIYFQYPPGGSSYVFKHTGWVSVALTYISLLLLISSAELLHPLKGQKTALRRNLAKSAFLYLGSLFFCCCMSFIHYEYMDIEIKDSLWALILFLVASLVCHCTLLFYTMWKAFKEKESTKSEDKLCSQFSICKFKSMFGNEKQSKNGIHTKVSQRKSQNRSSSLRSGLINRFRSHQYHPVDRVQDLLSNEPAPVSREAKTPVSTQAETPVTKKADPPVSTEAETPVSTEAETPASTEAETPVTKKAETPVSTPAETLVSLQGDPPVTKKADPPVSAEAEIPVSTEAETPVSTEAETPVSTPAETLVSLQGDPPVTKKADPPASTQADPSVSTEAETPVSTEAETPVSTLAETLVSMQGDQILLV